MRRENATQRNKRSEQESRALFDEHLITTRLRVQNIYEQPLSVQGKAKVQNVEEQLVLFQKKVRDNDVQALQGYILRDHPYLIKLHLNYNKISTAGAKVLAYLLDRDRCMLQELYLNKNALKDEGTSMIAKALENNTRLRQLKISSNSVGDAGALAVATMLTKNSALRGLEFDHNDYGGKALAALADALNRNDGIKVFQVGDSQNIRSRLQFVRMMIDTEDPEKPRTFAVLCFSKDRNNETLDLVLSEWRLCKKEGKKLIPIPREFLAKFQKFNRFSEADLSDLHSNVKHFLEEARRYGSQNVRQGKILVMGRAGAGKTSLTQSLISGRSLLTGDGPDRATVSVQIRPWTVDQVRCAIWDFGGQEEYYMTHSFFVTPRSVVLICVNCATYDCSDKAFFQEVMYYVDSIQCHAPGAKFVIALTQADKVSEAEGLEKKNHIKRLFSKVEAERRNELDNEIRKLDPENTELAINNGNSNNNGDVGDNNLTFENEDNSTDKEVIKSHRLTGTAQLEELKIDTTSSEFQSEKSKKPNAAGKLNKNQRHLSSHLQKKLLGKNSFHNAFMENMAGNKAQGTNSNTPNKLVSRGSIVLNEALDVEVEPASTRDLDSSNLNIGNKIQNQNLKGTSSKFGKLLRRDQFDDISMKKDPRQKVKEENLAILKERRHYRPYLVKVVVVSSANFEETVTTSNSNVDNTTTPTTAAQRQENGMNQLEKVLQKMITKTEMFDLGVDLPKSYAELYEALTGISVHYNKNNETKQSGLGVNMNPTKLPSMALRFMKSFSKADKNLDPNVIDEELPTTNLNGQTVDNISSTNNTNPIESAKGKGKFSVFKRRSSAPQDGLKKSAKNRESSAEEENTNKFGEIFNSRFRNGSKFKPIIQINDLYKNFTTNFENINVAAKNKNKVLHKKLFSEPADLHKALQILHELGYILWYKDNDILRDIVFVDPVFVVDMIKSVIRHNMFEDDNSDGNLNSIQCPKDMTQEEFESSKDEFRENAIVDTRILFQFPIWSSASQMERFHMLALMESFDLLAETPRIAEKQRYQKFFVPVYLKSCFSATGDNLQRMLKLENEVINNIETVPKFAKSLFLPNEGMTESQAQFPANRHSRTFFEEAEQFIRPKNIQWRYEFKNFFPEGLFLRLLVRCLPFISFHDQYKPTERFVVGKAALGVTLFLQAEYTNVDFSKAVSGNSNGEETDTEVEEHKEEMSEKLKAPVGALVLTAIQESITQSQSFKYNMSDIWQVFSLFAFEIEDLLAKFVGLETHVFVSFIDENIGKVIIPRENLEVHELQTNYSANQKVRRINVIIGSERVPLHYLIPPLYILPKTLPDGVDKAEIKFTTPELPRLSHIARIEYGLLLISAQLGEQIAGRKDRLQILFKQLVKYADELLGQLCEAMRPSYGKIIRGIDQSLAFLKEKSMSDIISLEPNIINLRNLQQSSFMYYENYLSSTHVQMGLDLCWELFSILEQKMIIKEHEPSKKKRGILF